jgi:hypothetical protein
MGGRLRRNPQVSAGGSGRGRAFGPILFHAGEDASGPRKESGSHQVDADLRRVGAVPRCCRGILSPLRVAPKDFRVILRYFRVVPSYFRIIPKDFRVAPK